MSNKGKRYLECPTCKRKRYCVSIKLGHDYINRVCSKGHSYKFKLGIPSQIINLEIEKLIPKIKTLFERDDTFFRLMRRR